jgi:hypothetical protein
MKTLYIIVGVIAAFALLNWLLGKACDWQGWRE